jgi:hypothetical protein
VDFFNEVSLLYGIVLEEEMPTVGPGEGFPPGFEYLWADGVKVRTPLRCSGPEYVDYVMTWVEEQINNDDIFPSSSGMSMCSRATHYWRVLLCRQGFPKNVQQHDQASLHKIVPCLRDNLFTTFFQDGAPWSSGAPEHIVQALHLLFLGV